MIRVFQEKDTDEIVRIWLESSIRAHCFIPADYWESKAADMRNVYLPLSDILVDEDEAGKLTGFAALIDTFLAALFIAPEFQNRGIGSHLLRFVKKVHPDLELCVYAENEKAISFYQKHGFRIQGERIEAETGCQELLMACS